MRDLTETEQRCLDSLGESANMFSYLPEVHPADKAEFTQAIHAAQNIILARPATEAQMQKRAERNGAKRAGVDTLPAA